MHAVIEILLTYYDKAYLASIDKKKARVKAAIPWDGDNAVAYAERLINYLETESL